MKRIYFLTMALCAFAFTANAQFLIEDDFELYTLGNMGIQNPTVWSVWTGDPVNDVGISVVEAGGEHGQVGYIGSFGDQDPFLLLGNRDTGDYTLIFEVLIPATKGGYFNIQGETEDPGTGYQAAGNGGAGVFNSSNIYFNNAGADPGICFDQTNGDEFPYPEDEWFTLRLDFDLDNTVYTMTVDGLEGTETDFQADAILGALDLFSIDGNNEMYVDNVYFATGVLGTSDFSADVFRVYPNPVKDVLNINSKAAVDSVVIYDVLGKVVIQAQPDAISPSIDMSALNSGAYLVNVTIGNASKTIKVIK